jgi:heme/copper-type cytochrome/quinol oxidase subunit 2
LPPAIGQDELPLGTSSGGAGAEMEDTADNTFIIVSTITILIILVLVYVIIRRRAKPPENSSDQ